MHRYNGIYAHVPCTLNILSPSYPESWTPYTLITQRADPMKTIHDVAWPVP